jgi:hypothetical protein
MLKLALYGVAVYALFYFGIAQLLLIGVANVAVWGAGL